MAKRRDTGPRSSAEFKIGALMLSKLMLCEDDELDEFRERSAAQLQPHVVSQLRDVLDALHICMSGADAQKLQQLDEAWSAFGGERKAALPVSSAAALPEPAAAPAAAQSVPEPAAAAAPPAPAAPAPPAPAPPAPAPPAPAPPAPAPPAPAPPAPAPPGPAPAPPAMTPPAAPPPVMPSSGVTPAPPPPPARKAADASSPWASQAATPPPPAAPVPPPAAPAPPSAAPAPPPAAVASSPAAVPAAPAPVSGGPPPSHQPAPFGDSTADMQKIDDPRTYTVDGPGALPDALPYRSNADAEPPPPVAEEVKAERFDADPLNATAYVEENPLHQLGAAMPFKSSSEDSAVDSALPAHLNAITLEQYAALSAECTTYPKWTEHVLKRYHVRDAAERSLLDQHWQARRDADPQLEEQYRWYYNKYEEWAKSQQQQQS